MEKFHNGIVGSRPWWWSLSVLQICLLLLAFCHTTGLASEEGNVIPAGTLAQQTPRKNAYGTMMYCGTPRDYEFHIASRVMLKTLMKTKPNADVLVFISKTCPDHWTEIYVDDGVRVVLVDDIHNPYKDQPKYNKRFLSALNKLYAWGLEEYDRVVMLDVDNMVLRNSDELFQCGDFCAVFVDPCSFHTGLFVLKPSNATYSKMVESLTSGLRSADGADQGFLTSYYPDLLNAPLFRPPTDGSLLTGHYRLPFGYQMDASYYYYRMKWNVPCGPNSVITFPGVSILKPWYWWSWPVLPLGLTWHELRRSTIGYKMELPVAALQAMVYILLLAISMAIRHHFPASDRAYAMKTSFTKCPCLSEGWHFPLCNPWLIKVTVIGLIVASFFVPYYFVPTVIHPFLGWGLVFLGSLSLEILLLSILYLPTLAVLTPWIGILINFIAMGLPIYSHGLLRMLTILLVAFVSSPFLWWALREISAAIDLLADREPLMSRICVKGRR
eukprot:jgi/Mesen1/6454/ME000033S05734